MDFDEESSTTYTRLERFARVAKVGTCQKAGVGHSGPTELRQLPYGRTGMSALRTQSLRERPVPDLEPSD